MVLMKHSPLVMSLITVIYVFLFDFDITLTIRINITKAITSRIEHMFPKWRASIDARRSISIIANLKIDDNEQKDK
jgi:hypothetical protein